ncbi:MAG: tripartite tricarboxylate transporter permease [Pygmaiobacter massiliensis]|nr:tripartite tricarboxylate transporter permease [Pygmaiobacter massiliensis]
MSYFFSGFGEILSGNYMLFMFAGVALGMVLGCLPGLTGSLGIALMLPFTYHMTALTALVFLLSIYTGGLFGGAITAIIINTTGSPANMVTMLDGYPMAKRGEGGRALGIALTSSVLGGLIGCVFLVMATEPLATFALEFGPGEMFMVVFFGLSCIGSLAKNPLKSIYSGLFGVLMGTVGMSAVGTLRGTYGNINLMDGIPMTPALIGFLALPEIIMLINQSSLVDSLDEKAVGPKSILAGVKDVICRPIQTVLCSVLGVIVGIIPAAGASVAGVLGYNQSKQWSKKGQYFGTGIPEGIVACETANNASEGGALATLFVLGIPGSSSTAMLLGALVLQGWNPGPKLFIDNKEIIYTAFSSLFLQQIVMLIIGFILCVIAVYIVKVPTRYLVPFILAFTLVGAYSSRNAIFDVGLMVMFGGLGFLMKKAEFPVMPLILGLLLGGDADSELLRIFQSYNHFYQIFSSPIVLVLAVVSVFCIVAPLITQARRKSA